MPSCGLAIFAKTPGYSSVKTRLAEGIGQTPAINIYELSLKAIEKTIKNSTFQYPDISPYWAVAETIAFEDPRWSSFPRLDQGSGDLGSRLSRIYTKLYNKYGRAILIGADSPEISPAILIETAKTLNETTTDESFVLGPAHDGGFYLFGGNCALPAHFWEEIPYSTPNTLSRLKMYLPSTAVIKELPYLNDLDTAADLWHVKADLIKNTDLNQYQIELLTLINNFVAKPLKILFLCVANSARSQMAEGLARSILDNSIVIASAGSLPKTVHPLSIQVMQEIGIDISRHSSKSISEVDLKSFDIVITLCAEEVCPIVPHGPIVLHFPVEDPASGNSSLDSFRSARDTLKNVIIALFGFMTSDTLITDTLSSELSPDQEGTEWKLLL